MTPDWRLATQGGSRLRPTVRVAVLSALLAVTMSCSRTPEACTAELGIHIDPRQATLAVGEELRPEVKTSTCGGSFEGKPTGLTLEPKDPSIASVNDVVITGMSPGTTVIDVRTKELGSLGTIEVRVIS